MLVKLVMVPECSHLDVLRACRVKRPGDFFTTDDSSIYLFLYACPEAELESALLRVFSVPLAELFDGQLRFPDRFSVEDELERFRKHAERVAVMDFSEMLVQADGAPSAVTKSPIVAANDTTIHAVPADASLPGAVAERSAAEPRTAVKVSLPMRAQRRRP